MDDAVIRKQALQEWASVGGAGLASRFGFGIGLAGGFAFCMFICSSESEGDSSKSSRRYLLRVGS